MTLDTKKAQFKHEIFKLVDENLNEINHLISGIDSPFTYNQIAEAQTLINLVRKALDMPRATDGTK